MRTPLDLPDPLRDRPFTVYEALALGVPHSRLRSTRLERPFWGVRSGRRVQGVGILKAYALRMPRHAFFIGTTAALLHELPLPPSRDAILPLHVAVPAGKRRVSARDIMPHHVTIAAQDVVEFEGVRVTTLERTWCDLAASGLTVSQLVAAGDAALWHRHPRTTLRRMAGAAARYDGRRGAATIRASLPLLDGRADSAPESELRVAISLAGAPAPEVNSAVLDGRRFVATPDLSWPRHRVALEYEGDHHRTDARQWHHDIARYSRLQELGWLVFRATAADYRDPSAIVSRVIRAIESR